MVSPFNGEGIAQALLSGRLAAQAAAQAAEGPQATEACDAFIAKLQ